MTTVDDMRTAYAEYIMDTHTTMYSPIQTSQKKSPNKTSQPKPIRRRIASSIDEPVVVYKLSEFL